MPDKISDRLAALIPEIVSLETSAASSSIKIKQLEDEIGRLKNGDGTTATPPPPLLSPPPLSPPPSPLPDITISYDNITFKPEGPGDLWSLSGERRWVKDIDKDIRIILDVKDRQVRVILQRAWSDLGALTISSIINPLVKVSINGSTLWDQPVRIHHHTRHCMTFNRLSRPGFDLDALKKSASIPNYPSNLKLPSPSTVLDNWQWALWEEKNPLADRWSENFGLATASWVGGVPLSNEGAMISPWDVALLHASDPALISLLWDYCGKTADSSGNYAVHYFDRSTSRPLLYDSPLAQSLPMFNADSLPALNSSNNWRLPVADIAHDMALVNVFALLTKERFYIEELESWVLLGSLCRKGTERSSGIYWSGQVRAAAWWLRNLYHLCRILSPEGYRFTQLKNNLDSMDERFARPTSSEYLPTGICSVVPKKESPWTKHSSPAPSQTSTGNLHFLSHVLGEIHRSGIVGNLAEPMLRHTLKAAKGTWESSPSKYQAGWLQHTIGDNPKSETWATICGRTFANSPKISTYQSPLTLDIVAWHRAAVVAAANLDEQWAVEALKQIDALIKSSNKQPSLSWQVEPVR